MPLTITSQFCIRCEENSVESIVHKFCECLKIIEAWNSLRDILETIDVSLVFETDKSLINLNYNETILSNSIIWLIGEYVALIEEVVSSNKSLSSYKLLSHLRSRWLECMRLSIPDIGFIPGLFPSAP